MRQCFLLTSGPSIELALRFFWKDHSRSRPFIVEDIKVKVQVAMSVLLVR